MTANIIKEKKLFLFDFDGTLADTSGDIENSINHLLNHYQLAILSFGHFRQHVGTGVHQLITGILEEFYPANKIDINEALAIYNEHHVNNLTTTVKLYPGVRELLSFLKKENKLAGIISNKYSFYTEKIVNYLQLQDLVVLIYGPDNVPVRKPAPDGIWQALKATNIPPAEAIIIGDSLPDILAGKKAGITTAAVTYGFNTAEKLSRENPDYLFSTLNELLQAIS